MLQDNSESWYETYIAKTLDVMVSSDQLIMHTHKQSMITCWCSMSHQSCELYEVGGGEVHPMELRMSKI